MPALSLKRPLCREREFLARMVDTCCEKSELQLPYVQTLDLGFSRKEIIDFIRTGRKPTKRANKALPPPSAVPSARKGRSPRRG